MSKPHPVSAVLYEALINRYGDSLRLLLELPATRSMRIRSLVLFATLATHLPSGVSELTKLTGLSKHDIISTTGRMRNNYGWLALEKPRVKRGSGRIVLAEEGRRFLRAYHAAFKDLGFDQYRYPGPEGPKRRACTVLADLYALSDEATLLSLFDLACLLRGINNMREMARFSGRSHGAPFLVVRTFFNMGLVEAENPESSRQKYRVTTKGRHLLGGLFYLVDQAITSIERESK